MTAPRPRSRQPKQLDAGIFQAEISSFALRLAAEGKAAKTIRTYTEAVQWFAAAGLPGRASWEQVDGRDIQQWMAWLLDRYSSAYASNQYRALQQFFKWLAAEDELPDPMEGLTPARHRQAGPRLHPRGADQAGAGMRGPDVRPAPRHRDHRGVHRDRHPAAELAGLRYDPGDPRRSDIDLGGGKSPSAARAARTASSRSATRPPAAWTGTCAPGPGTPRPGGRSCGWESDNREPLTAAGIYQMTARRGRQCGVDAYPHRFRHHFSHTWLDRGGPEGDLMELNGWASPQMLRRYGASARSARARRTYDRIMTDT